MLKRFGVALGSIALIASASGASAREWSRSSTDIASDYLTVHDNRGNGDQALIMWVAPPMVPNTGAQAKAIFSKTLFIGTLFFHVDTSTGEITVLPSGDVSVTNGAGEPIREIPESKRSPVLSGSVVVMGSAMSKALGKMGSGLVWRTYEAKSVDACKPGGLKIRLAGVVYDYDTPIPGC